MKDKKLTIKQEKFVENYAIGCNGAESARRAGYSERSSAEIAAWNLKQQHVIDAIAHRQQEYIKKVKIDNEFVLTRIIEIAELYKEDARHVASSLRALELIGKYLGIWDSDIRTVSMTHEEALKELE